jgi:hypothetical protein
LAGFFFFGPFFFFAMTLSSMLVMNFGRVGSGRGL